MQTLEREVNATGSDAPATPAMGSGHSGSSPVQLTTPPLSRRIRRRRHRRRIRLRILAVLLAVMSVLGYSIGQYLTRPGNEAIGVRFVEWVRDHGGNGVVNRVETWWYSHHQPPKGGTPKGGIPKVAVIKKTKPKVPAVVIPPPPTRPPDVPPIAAPALPGEGVWQPVGRFVHESPAVYETFLRPDPVHTSLLAGVAWMNHTLLRNVLYNGLEQPGGGPWTTGSSVSPVETPGLVAAFNSGFKLDSSRGGYFNDGRFARPLVDGRATLVVRTDGSANLGMWGRDFAMDPTIVSARQNLDLLIDGGQPAADLNSNDSNKWGATLGNAIFVWRSGVGIDADGNLIFVGGPGLDVSTLAGVLHNAGAVRAMELDINSYWVSFYTYLGGAPGDTPGTKLLDSMERSPTRFLEPGTRDFFGVFAR